MFRKIIIWFKKIFYRQVDIETLVPELKQVDGKALFNQIKEGDIIMAVTNCSSDQLVLLEEKHRTRPFIVAKKSSESLVAYSGSSNCDAQYKTSFKLLRNSYNIWKDGQIDLGKQNMLTANHLIRILDTLTLEDKLLINYLIFKNKKQKEKIYFEFSKQPQIGSIIGYQQNLYYIYDIEDYVFLCFMLRKKSRGFEVRIQNDSYYVSIFKSVKLNRQENHVQVCPLSDESQRKILTAATNMNRIYLPQVKHCQHNLKGGHRYQYPVGQIFSKELIDYIYLFTKNNKHYGIPINAYQNENQIEIHRIAHTCLIKLNRIVDPDQCLNYVKKVSSQKPEYQWLFSEIKEYYQKYESV